MQLNESLMGLNGAQHWCLQAPPCNVCDYLDNKASLTALLDTQAPGMILNNIISSLKFSFNRQTKRKCFPAQVTLAHTRANPKFDMKAWSTSFMSVD